MGRAEAGTGKQMGMEVKGARNTRDVLGDFTVQEHAGCLHYMWVEHSITLCFCLVFDCLFLYKLSNWGEDEKR